MTELLTQTPLPAFLLFLGAALAGVCRHETVRKSLFVLAPLAALIYVGSLEVGTTIAFNFLPGFGDAAPLKVTEIGKAFGYVFTINAVIVFVFGWRIHKPVQNVWALLYIGGALGVVFAGDLITLYVFWELMAVASTFVVLARNTNRARAAAFRYVMIHVLGGLFLLAGIVMTIAKTGSIAFAPFDYADADLGTWLMLIGVLVNAGVPPLSAWLSDTYPEASVTGSIVLSAYTTKTAVYVLLAGFAGWSPLIYIGAIAALYGAIFAIRENDTRRTLAYALISQIGFMICGAGIGTPLSISGATAHAFCCVLYLTLLWMAVSVVLYRTGKSRMTELGGLARSMPYTATFFIIGALTIAAFPLTNGFTSKTIILYAAEKAHLLGPWLALEFASAAAFLFIGCKMTWFIFFNGDRGLKATEAPATMITGMGLTAFLCLYLGVHPQPLYDLLPYVGDYTAYKPAKLVSQLQLLTFTAFAFVLFYRYLKPTPTIQLDTDWLYRNGTPLLYSGLDRGLNGLNAFVHRTFIGKGISKIGRFTAAGPAKVLILAMNPIWSAQGLSEDDKETQREKFYDRARIGAFPIGLTACLSIVLLAILLVSVR